MIVNTEIARPEVLDSATCQITATGFQVRWDKNIKSVWAISVYLDGNWSIVKMYTNSKYKTTLSAYARLRQLRMKFPRLKFRLGMILIQESKEGETINYANEKQITKDLFRRLGHFIRGRGEIVVGFGTPDTASRFVVGRSKIETAFKKRAVFTDTGQDTFPFFVAVVSRVASEAGGSKR